MHAPQTVPLNYRKMSNYMYVEMGGVTIKKLNWFEKNMDCFKNPGPVYKKYGRTGLKILYLFKKN